MSLKYWPTFWLLDNRSSSWCIIRVCATEAVTYLHSSNMSVYVMLLMTLRVHGTFGWKVSSRSAVCLYCVSGWQRSVSCQVTWRTISGRWETLVPVGPVVKSTTTASEAETLHTLSTWTTLMCWRSGIWCLSSSIGRIKALWLWVNRHVDAQTNLI